MTATTRIARRHPDDLIIGLVSVSDRASSGTYQDQG
ncbi:MAG TPA: molybdopterin adenylyltransferase, partial [Achromobacter sp.]|nr:molybdopterin adenylyltransferase [Achromobacter sp.]